MRTFESKPARGAADDAPLLLQADGTPWSESNPHGNYRRAFGEVAGAVGLAPDVTAYLFRHSSIARMLMRGLHTKLSLICTTLASR